MTVVADARSTATPATSAPPVPASRCPVSRPPTVRPTPPKGPPAVDPEAAAEFLTQFYAETKPAGSFSARMREVRREIAATGWYRHTAEELDLRGPGGLAQLGALHRPAVLEQPAGA